MRESSKVKNNPMTAELSSLMVVIIKSNIMMINIMITTMRMINNNFSTNTITKTNANRLQQWLSVSVSVKPGLHVQMHRKGLENHKLSS